MNQTKEHLYPGLCRISVACNNTLLSLQVLWSSRYLCFLMGNKQENTFFSLTKGLSLILIKQSTKTGMSTLLFSSLL